MLWTGLSTASQSAARRRSFRAALIPTEHTTEFSDSPSSGDALRSWCGLRTSDQLSRQRACRCTVPIGDRSGDDRRDETVRPLHQAPPGSRELVHHLQATPAYPIPVDHVDIGLGPAPDHTTIIRTEEHPSEL